MKKEWKSPKLCKEVYIEAKGDLNGGPCSAWANTQTGCCANEGGQITYSPCMCPSNPFCYQNEQGQWANTSAPLPPP